MHPHTHGIITFVRQGAITHRDNLGNEGRTVAGDVQVMSVELEYCILNIIWRMRKQTFIKYGLCQRKQVCHPDGKLKVFVI